MHVPEVQARAPEAVPRPEPLVSGKNRSSFVLRLRLRDARKDAAQLR
jgi:hypothetical protein